MCCYASTELNFWFYITVLCEFHRLYLLLNLLHCRINVWYTDLAANHWHQEYNRLSYRITILKNTIDCHIELPYSFLVVQYICKYMYKACWKRFPPELNWHSQFRVGPDTRNTFDFTQCWRNSAKLFIYTLADRFANFFSLKNPFHKH